MTESANRNCCAGLAEQWTGLLAQILESMTDQKPQDRLDGRPRAGAAADIFWWEQG